MTNETTDPFAYIHQTVVHQLRHAADKIENGPGLVAGFDYNEYTEFENLPGTNTGASIGSRAVEIELELLLPE